MVTLEKIHQVEEQGNSPSGQELVKIDDDEVDKKENNEEKLNESKDLSFPQEDINIDEILLPVNLRPRYQSMAVCEVTTLTKPLLNTEQQPVHGVLFLEQTYFEGLPVLTQSWEKEDSAESKASEERCDTLPCPPDPRRRERRDMKDTEEEKDREERDSSDEEFDRIRRYRMHRGRADSEEEEEEGSAEAKGEGKTSRDNEEEEEKDRESKRESRRRVYSSSDSEEEKRYGRGQRGNEAEAKHSHSYSHHNNSYHSYHTYNHDRGYSRQREYK